MGAGPLFTQTQGYLDRMAAQLQQQQQQQMAAAAQQPIPGLTGPRIPMGGLMPGNMPGSMQPMPVPMGPPITQIPNPQPAPFAASGPYGEQAMMMAGLLGRRQIPRPPPRYHGLLGRIPGGK